MTEAATVTMDPATTMTGADSLRNLSRSRSQIMQGGKMKDVVLIGSDRINPEADTPAKFICLDALSPELRAKLAHLDTDGDGVLDGKEVGNAVDDNKKTKAKLWNTRLFALLFFVSLGGALIGVILKGTDAVVKGNKDTKTADATAANTMSRALLTKDDEPIGVNQNEVELSFGSLKHMPEYVLKHVNDLIVKDPQGVFHYFKKEYAAMVPGKSVRIETSRGDVMWVDTDHEDKGTLTHVQLADGTEWTSPSCCTDCHATSLVANDDILAGLVAFNEAMAEAQGDRKLYTTGSMICYYCPQCCFPAPNPTPTPPPPAPAPVTFSLPATTTDELVHGICVQGSNPASAASPNNPVLTYTAVSSLGQPQAWGDRAYVLKGAEDQCGDGIFLRPSHHKSIQKGTIISITATQNKWVCVFYENVGDRRHGGWTTSLDGSWLQDTTYDFRWGGAYGIADQQWDTKCKHFT